LAEDKDLAEQAGPFLQASQDPAAEVTAFAPVNAAFAPLDGVEFNPATVLMFHAVPEMMEPGQAYDTAAGPDAGQLTIVAEGNQTTVSGPCNSANVAMTVDVCGSVVHVVDAVLLPASFCEAKDEDDEDDHDHDHDHDHDDDHDDDDDDDDDDNDDEKKVCNKEHINGPKYSTKPECRNPCKKNTMVEDFFGVKEQEKWFVMVYKCRWSADGEACEDKEVEKKNGNVIPCYGDKAWEKSDKDNWGKCEAIKGFEVINASPPPPTQTQDG